MKQNIASCFLLNAANLVYNTETSSEIKNWENYIFNVTDKSVINFFEGDIDVLIERKDPSFLQKICEFCKVKADNYAKLKFVEGSEMNTIIEFRISRNENNDLEITACLIFEFPKIATGKNNLQLSNYTMVLTRIPLNKVEQNYLLPICKKSFKYKTGRDLFFDEQ